MMNAKVNDNEIFTINHTNGQLEVNNEAVSPDWIKIGENKFHGIINHKSYTVELRSKDETGKQLNILVNGVSYQVALENEFDVLLKKLGMDKLAGNKINNLKAPMPGLVLRLMVEPGATVKKGDPILVLEAMKMENIIKAAGDGVVKKINVSEKIAVEKNQVLVEFE